MAKDIKRARAALLAASLLACAPAHAQETAPDDHKPVTDASKANEDDIAKESQNPIGNLTILPFENYANFGVGPHDGTQNVLEFEPVVPFHITPDWNIIARAVIPVVWNPDLAPARSVPQAIAPTDFSTFLSASHPFNGWTWGVGPIVQVPTATNPSVGSSVWGLGPTAVAVWTGGISSPACWPTKSGRSAASPRARAAGAMRRSSWSPSLTTISAAAGSSAPRRSSPKTNTPPDGNGQCPSALWRAG